jgi:hypothetical protein
MHEADGFNSASVPVSEVRSALLQRLRELPGSEQGRMLRALIGDEMPR